MRQVAETGAGFLRGLSPQQKVMVAGGAILVGLTLWGFVFLFGQAKSVTLYSGLRPADAQSLAARLAAKNIPYEISPDGATVLVPAEKLDAARLETAAQGLPRNARLGFELFDTPNWAVPISARRSIISARSKANWSARCRRSMRSRRCASIWCCRASRCSPTRSTMRRRR